MSRNIITSYFRFTKTMFLVEQLSLYGRWGAIKCIALHCYLFETIAQSTF